MLSPPAADPGITDDERRTINEMMAKGTYGMLLLATDDLDGAFAKVKNSSQLTLRESSIPVQSDNGTHRA